ncbi:MAG: hypothetical protein KJ579_09130 [Verrucomicrobia bacterium]|nr:hypothetical protein [Verrucomicrobiota bacterium]
MNIQVVRFGRLIVVVVFMCTMDARSGERDALSAGESAMRARESNRVVRAKEIFRFDQLEREAPRYRAVVTNWAPVLAPCDGITNFVFTGSASGNEMSYQGRDGSRWVNVVITCCASASEAHEYLMMQLASKSIGTIKATDLEEKPTRRIGYRCTRTEIPGVSEVIFIRNNCHVRVSGRYVKVESLARELDRQILEVSNRAEGSPGGGRPDRREGTNTVDDAGSGQRRTRTDGSPP